jgi:2-C-methyl-D-erythritol 2,4-cyclodiphosphate synthase
MHYAVITTVGDDKLLLEILNKPVLYYTIAVFYDHPLINKIIIIVNKKIKGDVEKIIKENFPGNSKDIKIISEGKTKEKSLTDGVEFIKKNNKIKTSDLIILHDGANPLVTYKEIEACIKNSGKSTQIKYIPASDYNFKIITPADYIRAKHIIGDIPDDFIFGIGQDSHEASNGDIVSHALFNAILQALGEKSLGAFGDDSCEFKNVKDSKKYLKTLLLKAKKNGYLLKHLGFMIERKKPVTDIISRKIKKSINLLTGLTSNEISVSVSSGKKNQCFCVASLKSE